MIKSAKPLQSMGLSRPTHLVASSIPGLSLVPVAMYPALHNFVGIGDTADTGALKGMRHGTALIRCALSFLEISPLSPLAVAAQKLKPIRGKTGQN
jgi:hypothetical protein